MHARTRRRYPKQSLASPPNNHNNSNNNNNTTTDKALASLAPSKRHRQSRLCAVQYSAVCTVVSM